MDNSVIKQFINNIKEGKNEEARKNVESLLYAMAASSVKDVKKQVAKSLFSKK